MAKKINVITLGCSKNVVDSERVMAQLAAAGYRVVHDEDGEGADIVVINTCGFIGDAKEESIETILRYARARQDGRIESLYVIGCLSERYRDELKEEIPEVDSFFGARNLAEIVEELGSGWRSDLAGERILTTPSHYAYLKISEGCDRRCGFCAIPLIRGPHVSVPEEELLQEARVLASRGVKELIIIAQDTTYYGIDLYGERRLARLLEKLCRVEGISWIRLHYAYPAGFPEDVLDVMAREPKICKYLDIPLQHISDNQLRSMKRGMGKAGTTELIRKLRESVPGIAIRTTMLVGYPGETDEDFRELMQFVEQTGFERLGAFAYSEEEGTYSAGELADDVPPELKQERLSALMKLQSGISLKNNVDRIGGAEKVLVDDCRDGFYVARSGWDSPEVDQELLIPVEHAPADLKPGDFCMVRITGAEEFDLTAEFMYRCDP